MTGAAVVRAASAGAARRLVQTMVIAGVLAASSAAAALGLTLLTSANEGFYAAFAAAHGAELAVTFDASKVTAAELARTAQLPGVTQAAGPYPQTTFTIATGKPGGGGLPPQQLTVVGRASPSGALDRITVNPGVMAALTHGRSRWPARPGEISIGIYTMVRLPLGSTVTVTSVLGRPELTVVGYAGSPARDEDAWVAPAQVAALEAAGAPVHQQMLYNFTHAGTTAQLNADLAELKHALPPGAVVTSVPWLASAGQTGAEQQANTPFVIAFAVLALVLAVLIVANVVSAAVAASYRRIGVLKSIGFTPAQVTAAYLAQIGVPALAGAVAGTFLGGWWALPVLNFASSSVQAVPLWIDVSVPLGMCALTALAAALPAVRAGRLPAAAVITAGQAPRTGRGYAPHRLAGRLALPRPVTLGLAAPLARPARSAATLAALTFGLAGVVLAASLTASIGKINHSAIQGLGQVQATYRGGRQYTLTPAQNTKILAALRAQPATSLYVGETDLMPTGQPAPGQRQQPASGSVSIGVAGRPGMTLMTYAYHGDSSWLGWNLVSGRWYGSPHEVDASTTLLQATGLNVGDNLVLTVGGMPVTVRIAGEVFVPTPAPTLFTSTQALGTAAAGLAVSHYDITLTPGTSIGTYTSNLARQLGPGYIAYPPAGPSVAALINATFFRQLAWLVAVLAALGVLNSVLMATRERVHDLGVFKAVGMTPRQTITMVICWVITPAIIAALIAVPAGLTLQDALVRHLASQSGLGPALPGSFVHVLNAADLLLLALGGLAIAAAGALGPATWAATAETTTALRTE